MTTDSSVPMTVRAWFAVRVEHPEIHVGVVGVPGKDDPNVNRQVLEQALVEIAQLQLFSAGGDYGVHFVERGQLDFGEAPVPSAFHDLLEQVDGSLVLLVGGEGEGEVAVGLWFLLAHLQDFLEDGHGELWATDLHEAITENAQELRVLQFHFRHVGEDAQGEIGILLFDEEIGDVEEEGGASLVLLALLEVDGIPVPGFGFLELGEVGGLRVPLLELDGTCGSGAS